MCFRKHWVIQDVIIINLLDARSLNMENLSSLFKKEDDLLQNLSDQQPLNCPLEEEREGEEDFFFL